MNKIICWFSCGVTSAVACKLALNKYGKENCILIYIEIDSVHPDNERFILECEKWYGTKIERRRSNKYKSHFDVIEKIKYVNGVHGAPCTLKLKKEVRYKIEDEIKFDGQVFGFENEKHELNRAKRFQEQYPDSKPIFPLIERGLNKAECAYILIHNNIEIPEMYKLGFNNNNCIGCVKGGMGYWNKIKIQFPKEFNRMAELEQKIGATCLKDKFLFDLQPDDGRNESDLLPDCGLFCEIEFADLL